MRRISRYENSGRRDERRRQSRSLSRSSSEHRYKRKERYRSSKKGKSHSHSRSRTYSRSRSPERRTDHRRKRKSRRRSRTYSKERTPQTSKRKSRHTSRDSRSPPKSCKYDASSSSNVRSLKNLSSLGSLVGLSSPTASPIAMSSDMMQAMARHMRPVDSSEPPPPGVPVSASPSPSPPPPTDPPPPAPVVPPDASTISQPALSYIPMPPANGVVPCFAPPLYSGMPLPPSMFSGPPMHHVLPQAHSGNVMASPSFTPFIIRPPVLGSRLVVTPMCFAGDVTVPPPPPPEQDSNHANNPSTSAQNSTAHGSVSSSTLMVAESFVKRDYEKPVILNKRKLPDVSENWGIGCFSNYKITAQVGEGTYGQVYKAVSRADGRTVALKRVRLENEREGFPITAIRETKILRQLDHRNVVKLFDIVTDQKSLDKSNNKNGKDTGSFYLVFEYVDHDLNGLLDSNMIELSELQTASIFKQLLLALEHCHNLNFLHRDIKCANILINNRGELKLADFGLARIFLKDVERLYTNRVITLWYRPPELLLGQERYGTEVDIWSAGCILGELFWKKPIFQGNVEHAQLEIIAQSCGSPSPEVWPDVVHLSNFKVMRTKTHYQRRVKEKFAFMPQQALDLFDCLLQLDPQKRPSASDALNHPWLVNVDPDRVPPLDLPKNQDCHEMWSKKLRAQNRSFNNSSGGGSTLATRNPSSSSGNAADYSNLSFDSRNNTVS